MNGSQLFRNGHAGSAAKLRALQNLAQRFGDAAIARDADDLASRIETGRFYVACVGQFKRGKSTLINALVGDALLPVGIVPVTAVPTIVRYGDVKRARVHFRDGADVDIGADGVADYVSQQSNPDNCKNVDAVEIFAPSPFLIGGMCLVDTPGIGSVFAANSETARAFVPQIDVALVVLGADPPLAGAELDLVTEIAQQVQDLIIVLNKADRNAEAELRTATEFTQDVLRTRIRTPVGHIFQVSALRQWEGALSWGDWDALTAALACLSDRASARIRISTRERGESRLSRRLAAMIDREIEAMRRPLEESEARIAHLRDLVVRLERSLGDLNALLTNEQSRLARQLRQRRREFLATSRETVHTQLRKALANMPRTAGPSFRRAAFRAAQIVAQAALLPWLSQERAEIERDYATAMRRFVETANEFVQRESDGGIDDLALEGGLVERSRFQFYDFITVAQPASPLRFLLDLVLAGLRRYGSFSKGALNFLDLLMETNAARVESDFNDRMAASRAQMEGEIKARLRELIARSERATQRAATAQRDGQDAIRRAVEHLSGLRNEVLRIGP